MSAYIDPHTIVSQGMLLTKRIKKQFSGVQELDGEMQGREGRELQEWKLKYFLGKKKSQFGV